MAVLSLVDESAHPEALGLVQRRATYWVLEKGSWLATCSPPMKI